MADLKPCPFCGGSILIQSLLGEWWISCADCGGQTDMHNSEEAAIEAWNRRADNGD